MSGRTEGGVKDHSVAKIALCDIILSADFTTPFSAYPDLR